MQMAKDLSVVLSSLDMAIAKIEHIRDAKRKDSHGHEAGGNDTLYSMYMMQYSDGSGFNIDLTNCGIGLEVLRHTLELLKSKREDILKQIEKL